MGNIGNVIVAFLLKSSKMICSSPTGLQFYQNKGGANFSTKDKILIIGERKMLIKKRTSENSEKAAYSLNVVTVWDEMQIRELEEQEKSLAEWNRKRQGKNKQKNYGCTMWIKR